MNTAFQIVDFSIKKDVPVNNDELRCALKEKQKHHQIKPLEESINCLLHHPFGLKSMRFDERQQLLFDNKEVTCDVESATNIGAPTHTRKTGGRNPTKDLPRVRVEHGLSEEEKQYYCGHCLTQIDEETSCNMT